MSRRPSSRRHPLHTDFGSRQPPPRFDDFVFIDAGDMSLEEAAARVHESVSDISEESDGFDDPDAVRRIIVYDLGLYGPPKEARAKFYITPLRTTTPQFSFEGAVAILETMPDDNLIDYYLDNISVFEYKYADLIDLVMNFDHWSIRSNVGTLSKRVNLEKTIREGLAATQREIASGKHPPKNAISLERELKEIEDSCDQAILLSRRLSLKHRLG